MEARDERAAEDLDTWRKVLPPQDGFAEQCYYHTLKNGEDGTFAAIYNPTEGVGVALEFDTGELDYFTQWKMMGKGEYVLGLEPGNCNADGRAEARRRGTLRMLEPGEEKRFHLRIRVIEDQEQAEKYCARS